MPPLGSPGISIAGKGKVERSRRFHRALQSESSTVSCRLFAPQRHRNFGTLISEDDLAILNRPERHVINIFAELQAKLLALLHDLAIQDRIARSCAHRDRSQGERAGRQVRAGSRDFRPRPLPTDRPERIAPVGSRQRWICSSTRSLGPVPRPGPREAGNSLGKKQEGDSSFLKNAVCAMRLACWYCGSSGTA